jgi:hypothetical protein
MSAVDELADRIVGMTRRRSAHVERFKVVQAAPLVLDQIEGSLILEEGDPDFEIAAAVDSAAPVKGDMVLVHQGADGDWIATGVVKRGED